MKNLDRRGFLGALTASAALLLVGKGSAQPRDRDNDGDRERFVILHNTGRRPHQVHLRDRDDGRDHTYTVQPGERLRTHRGWESDTTVRVDGERLGRLREIGRLEHHNGGRVWVVQVHGNGH